MIIPIIKDRFKPFVIIVPAFLNELIQVRLCSRTDFLNLIFRKIIRCERAVKVHKKDILHDACDEKVEELVCASYDSGVIDTL